MCSSVKSHVPLSDGGSMNYISYNIELCVHNKYIYIYIYIHTYIQSERERYDNDVPLSDLNTVNVTPSSLFCSGAQRARAALILYIYIYREREREI